MQCPLCAMPVSSDHQTCPSCGAGLNEGADALRPGTTLQGRYRLDTVLGQGGFGITYAATQQPLDVRVAVKELFPSGSTRLSGVRPPTTAQGVSWAQARQDFLAEARTLAQFNHPDIVRVVDFFEANDTAYLVMEHLEGETLAQRISRTGALPVQEVLTLARRILAALAAVHGAGLLHRDLKPDNVFLERSGRIVLIDFGSARTFATQHTASHTRLVTPGYAPLEQYASRGRFGPYTDLYALGATLHHALTGEAPPAATELAQGTPLPAVPPGTPQGLRTLLRRCLALRVTDRPQSCADAQADLDGPPTAPHSPAPTPTPAPPPRRRVGLWPPLLAGVVLVAGGVAWQASRTNRTAPPEVAPAAVVPAPAAEANEPLIPAVPDDLPTPSPQQAVMPPAADEPPAPAVEPTAPAAPDSAADEDARTTALVERYLSSASNDVTQAMSLYGDQVRYYQAGVKPRAFVQADKQKYYRRWPTHEYQLTSEVATVAADGPRRTVRFDYTFHVARPGHVLNGRGYAVLVLERHGDTDLIVGEDGGVY